MAPDATWLIDPPAPGQEPVATVLLAHGAGGSMTHATCERLARVLNGCGCETVRFNFPYRQRGSGPPDRMPALKAAYRDVCAQVREVRPNARLIGAGHSMGGRVASMLASEAQLDADGLLLFAYPLHPAGKTDRLRDAHLPDITLGTLALSGTRDRLCDQALMQAVTVPASWEQVWVEGADHSFDVLKRSGRTPEDIDIELRDAINAWLAKDPIQ